MLSLFHLSKKQTSEKVYTILSDLSESTTIQTFHLFWENLMDKKYYQVCDFTVKYQSFLKDGIFTKANGILDFSYYAYTGPRNGKVLFATAYPPAYSKDFPLFTLNNDCEFLIDIPKLFPENTPNIIIDNKNIYLEFK